MDQTEDTTELSWSEQVEAELTKKKANPSYVMTLPEGAVIDASMPDGYYRKRPCKEEFLAAYPNSDYDEYFRALNEDDDGIMWGPPWSDPQWNAKKLLENMTVPEYFQVQSQVRRVATRSKRAAAPTRHRFKQFLFGNPSFRMVRGRNVKVPAMVVLTNLDELIAKEEAGLLSVHLPDGRYIDLMALKAGQLAAASVPTPAPQPNPPLDSITQDVNGGQHIPEMLDGTYYNDPAAERAVENMLKDKANEQHRSETTAEEDAEASKVEAGKSEVEQAPAAAEEVQEPTAEGYDPAAERTAETASEEPEATEEEAPKTMSSQKPSKKGGKK